MPTTFPGDWWVFDTGPQSAAYNMALDEALLESATTHARAVLRFYGWTEPAATFGYFQHYAEVATWTELRPLVRRPTGGGLVPHVRDWTYSVAVPPGHPWYEHSAVESYRRLHDWVRRALARVGVTTELAPCCDPAGPGQCFIGAEKFDLIAGRIKVAGAAQRRNKLGLLIQGSVQPRPEWPAREAWEDSMPAAGSLPGLAETFTKTSLPEALNARAAELAVAKYATAAYTERR